MIDRNKTVCFTGHKKFENERLAKLPDEIDKAIQNGYDTFLSGGTAGFEQYAAMLIIKLREKQPNLRLILILPCEKENMGKKWNKIDKRIFEFVTQNADEIIVTDDNYFDGCMRKRNQMLVDLSSYCITYYCKRRSTTGQTIKMAEEAGIPITNIYDMQ